MRRSVYIAGLMVLLTVPMQAHADLLVYCAGLPGCGPLKDFTRGLLNLLLQKFDTTAYLLGALFIMIGGAFMLASGFNEEYYNKGKTTIIWAVVGMFIAQSAAALVGFITQEVESVPGNSDVITDSIHAIIGTIFDLLKVGLLAVAVYCGMRMVISRGQEEEFKKSREGLFYAALGAIIVNLADGIATAIRTF